MNYKQLWIYTYNYLRVEKGVDNVLFTYSTDAFDGRDEYLARYPGDDYVDILGWDDYKSIRTTDTRDVFHKRISTINDLAREKDKVASLSETGYETISVDNWWTSILLDGIKTAPETDKIAYVLVWRNARKDHHYAPYPGHSSEEDFISFYKDSITVFLSDLPKLYH
jgi:mannan endo-1,4-beta-mannosidase